MPVELLGDEDEKFEIDPQPLMELIQNTVGTDTWKNGGVGGPSKISFDNSTLTLMVSQSPDVHDEIQDLLEKLRELDDITIDMKGFLTVIAEEDLTKTLGRDVSVDPSLINEMEVKLLHGQSLVNDSVSGYEFKPVSLWNGQETMLEFPDLDIAITNSVSVHAVSSHDRKSVRSAVLLYDVNVEEPKYEEALNPKHFQDLAMSTDRRSVALVSDAENGQCTTVDVSSILPADKAGFRAILVLRPYVLSFASD